MTGTTSARARPKPSPRARQVAVGVVALVVLIAMAVSTRYVAAGAAVPGAPVRFEAAAYGKKQFPVQQKAIASKAVEAGVLGEALATDQTAAAERYGVSGDGGAATIVPVKLTGVVGEVPAAGYTPVEVKGLPSGTQINVQLGPAINGTDLRDATGTIQLGDFENQIQYQDAATAINDQLKTLLTRAGAPDLEGKTVQVTGVFSLINPKVWNVTPSQLTVSP